MRKLIKLTAALSMAAMVAGCAQAAPPVAPNLPEEHQAEAPGDIQAYETAGFELAIVTDTSTINDRSFNQGSWEGIQRAAATYGLTPHFYTAGANNTSDLLSTVGLAVQGGARLVVMPGFLLQPAAYFAQDIHPDVTFVLVDGYPYNPETYETRIEPNVVSIIYAEEQAGFLAGYAAVMEGHRSLGFMGGVAVPQVVSFGFGFLQGAEHAAAELGLAPGDVTVMYYYTGTFSPGPEVQATAASWFSLARVEVIFTAGGSMGLSVMTAAEANGGLVIGVDVDQYHESPTVLTSALKELGNAVYDVISQWYNGTLEGGRSQVFNAANHGIGLPMETSRFQNFTQEQYETILASLAQGEIDIIGDHTFSIDGLGLYLIDITAIN